MKIYVDSIPATPVQCLFSKPYPPYGIVCGLKHCDESGRKKSNRVHECDPLHCPFLIVRRNEL